MMSAGEAENPKPPPPPSAAKEALGLAAYLLALWSRHRDSLHALASGGELTGEDKEVVGRLAGELKALGEVMGENKEEGEEEGDDQGESTEGPIDSSGKRKRKKGRCQRRRNKGQSPPPQALVSSRGGESGGAAGSIPDAVLMRVVEILGTPSPPRCVTRLSEIIRQTSVKDLMAMSRACRRWKGVVRSSGVWKAVCEWRWPCLSSEGAQGLDRVMYWDPRHRLTDSLWMDLCMRTGRCNFKTSSNFAGIGDREGAYMMMVSVTLLGEPEEPLRRLLSQAGVMAVEPADYEGPDPKGLSAKCLVGEGAWGGIRAWPLEEALSPATGEEDLMAALCDKAILVEVQLIDRDTCKVATWYETVVRFDKENPHDPNSALLAHEPLTISIPNTHYQYHHRPRLVKVTDGPGQTTINLELRVQVSDFFKVLSFARLLRSLDWS